MTRLIVIDATPYGPEPSGTKRRAIELMRRVPQLLPDDVFEMHWARDGATPPDDLAADNLVHAAVEVSCRGGARRWFARGRDLRRRHDQTAFTHLLCDYGPVLRPHRVANLVTLHDLRFVHGYGGRLRRLYGRFGYGRLLRAAAQVITVSASVGAEAAAHFRLGTAPLVLPNAAAAFFTEASAEGQRAGALVVARDEPRKAVGAAYAATAATGIPITVIDDGRDDTALRGAYRSAAWLLAPSLEEGFNLPIAEALACGTPVIASDIPAHRDLLALGARGLTLVRAPTRGPGGAWHWPEAVARLSEPPPVDVGPPAWGWDAAADALAAAISNPGGSGAVPASRHPEVPG